ncbi:murein transglycosylase A [Sphingomonas profundi]|uniref:murein transglycosylase A n=1 Tax=Alterirhizorhabdus profundi TaxID=2681549 RepID=UPI0030CBC3B1
MSRARFAGVALAALALAGCVGPGERSAAPPPPSERPAASTAPATPVFAEIRPPVRGAHPLPEPPTPLVDMPVGDRAAVLGVRPGPPVPSLGIQPDEARAALAAFRLSCPSLVRRTDASGLTRGEDWRPACAAAPGWRDGDAAAFFARYFETAVVGAGTAFATGYYEPEIAGSRDRRPGYDVPIYRRPPDLIEADLGLFAPDLKGRKVRGQAKDGKLLLYPDRAAIVRGAIAGRGLELAWAADPIEFFFLQVQGSGRLRLPDGRVMRIGYDSQNGRDYVGIGALMKGRGLLEPGQSSMQGIMAWLRAHPEEGRAIMDENKSFVFFRELTGGGPIGAMGVPVTGRTSVAADPAFVPLGAPLFVALDRGEASGLWVAQDTGGAIKGANRFDTFWGAGEEARRIAGGMSGRGQAWLLLPIGTVARLTGAGYDGPASRP